MEHALQNNASYGPSPSSYRTAVQVHISPFLFTIFQELRTFSVVPPEVKYVSVTLTSDKLLAAPLALPTIFRYCELTIPAMGGTQAI